MHANAGFPWDGKAQVARTALHYPEMSLGTDFSRQPGKPKVRSARPTQRKRASVRQKKGELPAVVQPEAAHSGSLLKTFHHSPVYRRFRYSASHGRSPLFSILNIFTLSRRPLPLLLCHGSACGGIPGDCLPSRFKTTKFHFRHGTAARSPRGERSRTTNKHVVTSARPPVGH